MGQSGLFFVYFCYFLDTISIIQIEKSVDGVLGIRTRGHRMVGTDETTELWRPPKKYQCLLTVGRLFVTTNQNKFMLQLLFIGLTLARVINRLLF